MIPDAFDKEANAFITDYGNSPNLQVKSGIPNTFYKVLKHATQYKLNYLIRPNQWPSLQNLFGQNYVAISITSVKIIGKYAPRGVNHSEKSFITLATDLTKCFIFNLTLHKEKHLTS